jgi:hypothetical protein
MNKIRQKQGGESLPESALMKLGMATDHLLSCSKFVASIRTQSITLEAPERVEKGPGRESFLRRRKGKKIE